MDLDLVGLVDASAVLGVSPERVRQLVVAGDLPGVRFGNAWAVPRGSVLARQRRAGRRGRPLGVRRAWEAIVAREGDFSNAGRYRNRAEPRRYEMSQADVDHLSVREDALVSGVAAAIGHSEPLSGEGGGADLYLPRSLFDRLPSIVAAVEHPLGDVVVRIVADDIWPFVRDHGQAAEKGRLAPRAAVALDLMESGDPRHWIAAESLLASDG